MFPEGVGAPMVFITDDAFIQLIAKLAACPPRECNLAGNEQRMCSRAEI